MPVGGVRPAKIDLRAWWRRPIGRLEALVAQGDFRADLFARLAGFTFVLPSVRERRDDIGLLIAAFAADRKLRFTLGAGRALLRHDWPLNVRELRHALDVAAALADGDWIDLVHLPAAVAQGAAFTASESQPAAPVDPLREQLVASLVRHGGNVERRWRGSLGKSGCR